MHIIIVDCETTGLDAVQHDAIEIAWGVYHIEYGLVCLGSTLLPTKLDAFETTPVHGIVPSACKYTAGDVDVKSAMLSLEGLTAAMNPNALGFVAHNADFDKAFFEKIFASRGIKHDIPWMCSMTDIQWREGTPKKLVDLSLHFGVGVSAAHRAYDDVLILARVFDRIREGGFLKEMLLPALELAKEPKVFLEALVSIQQKDLAKNAGFHFDWDKKKWIGKFRMSKAKDFPFAVREV